MNEALDTVRARLRDQGFEQVMLFADTAASLCRSIGEAAYRGDGLQVGVHLKQLRTLCLAMIATYKEDLDGGRAQAIPDASQAGGGFDRRRGDGDAGD